MVNREVETGYFCIVFFRQSIIFAAQNVGVAQLVRASDSYPPEGGR